jgi:hypothetical protein
MTQQNIFYHVGPASGVSDGLLGVVTGSVGGTGFV